ncbi:MAG: hypothetical protein KGQ60_15585, partial [Planctomycetes bacterium]|nr:hypothetical protein [Planctomycetota bacterium]
MKYPSESCDSRNGAISRWREACTWGTFNGVSLPFEGLGDDSIDGLINCKESCLIAEVFAIDCT